MKRLSIEKLQIGVAARKLIDSMPVEFWKEEWMMKNLNTLQAGTLLVAVCVN